jgi:uncharacterized membrane protein
MRVNFAYLLFKFLHVAGVIVWVGGTFALVVLNARMARTSDAAGMAALGRQSEDFGRAALGPAAGIALLAGFATAGSIGFSFGSLWIIWGLVGFVVSIAVGTVAVGRAAAALAALAPTAAPDDPRLAALRQRLTLLSVINLLVLASVVWAMIFKPTL